MMARFDGASAAEGFSTRSVIRTTSSSAVVSTAAHPYRWICSAVYLHQRDDGRGLRLADLDHAGQQRIARVDQVVPEHDGEGLVTDVLFGPQHGVAETLRVALSDEVDVRERAGLDDPGELRLVALLLKGVLELGHAVEVIGEGVLVASDDDEHVVDPRCDGFFDDVLDGRLVDDGQHLLRHGLGGGKESRAQARGGDDCFDTSVHASTLRPSR